MTVQGIELRPLVGTDRPWLEKMLREHWGSLQVARQGELIDASILPGFVVQRGPERIGLVTYRLAPDKCEVVTINSIRERIGVGKLLIHAVRDVANKQECVCLSVYTTNDNTNALEFYHKLGFQLRARFPGAVEESRLLKPEIPVVGANGVPIRDEIYLELPLRAD